MLDAQLPAECRASQKVACDVRQPSGIRNLATFAPWREIFLTGDYCDDSR